MADSHVHSLSTLAQLTILANGFTGQPPAQDTVSDENGEASAAATALVAPQPTQPDAAEGTAVPSDPTEFRKGSDGRDAEKPLVDPAFPGP